MGALVFLAFSGLAEGVLLFALTFLFADLDNLICGKGKLSRKLREVIQIAVISIEGMPLIFQNAEYHQADLNSQK